MWNLEHGPEQTGANVKTLERERWGCVNADPKGVFLLAANARFDMQREGVSPNTLIVPPRMGIFCAWNEQRTSYKESGPKADVVLYGEQLNIPRIVGCDVHECESFDVDFSADPINQCARHRQCGEFFVVDKDAVEVQIYSAASDTFETITRKQMQDAAGDGSGDGSGKEFVIFRPHQTWEMSTAIMCERGEGLGVTFHGNHSFLLQSGKSYALHLLSSGVVLTTPPPQITSGKFISGTTPTTPRVSWRTVSLCVTFVKLWNSTNHPPSQKNALCCSRMSSVRGTSGVSPANSIRGKRLGCNRTRPNAIRERQSTRGPPVSSA